jgi:hypothetical protein
MTSSGGHVNPLERSEAPLLPAPPLDCPHEGECSCHVDVDATGTCYALFEQHLGALGKLQDNGLFVVVSGPSQSGKTSLINRCLGHAKRTLDDLRVTHEVVDLSEIGRTTGVAAQHRADMVRRTLVRRVKGLDSIFRGPYEPPEAEGERPPLLEEYTDALAEALLDDCVLIVRTPRTEQPHEVGLYWGGTQPRMLVFCETIAQDLSVIPENWAGKARPCVLRLGALNTGDTLKFLTARIHVDGCGRSFPDLDSEAMKTFFGDPPTMTIGAVQTTLYKVYDYYLHHQWPTDGIVRENDIQRIIAESFGRREGRSS